MRSCILFAVLCGIAAADPPPKVVCEAPYCTGSYNYDCIDTPAKTITLEMKLMYGGGTVYYEGDGPLQKEPGSLPEVFISGSCISFNDPGPKGWDMNLKCTCNDGGTPVCTAYTDAACTTECTTVSPKGGCVAQAAAYASFAICGANYWGSNGRTTDTEDKTGVAWTAYEGEGCAGFVAKTKTYASGVCMETSSQSFGNGGHKFTCSDGKMTHEIWDEAPACTGSPTESVSKNTPWCGCATLSLSVTTIMVAIVFALVSNGW